MIEIIVVLKIALLAITTLILTVGLFVGIEILRVAISIRRAVNRIASLTDPACWSKAFEWIRKIPFPIWQFFCKSKR